VAEAIIMFLSYGQAIAKYGSDYHLKKALKSKKMYKIKPGVYSFDAYSDDMAELFVKYDNIVLTLRSAFYYHKVSDYIPDDVHIATPKNAYPIKMKNVKQYFIKREYFDIGIKEISRDNYTLRIYDLERSLIELIRYETKIPHEEYLHVLKRFREINDELDFYKLTNYAKHFKSYKKIINTIQHSIM
jgi:predicted transcriptional regulator of viral defense system